MSYKIAVASTDEIHVNQTFGGTSEYLIYDVTDENVCSFVEKRSVKEVEFVADRSGNCGNSASGSCSTGCSSSTAGGCGGNGEDIPRVRLVSDCRCVICKKIGFKVEKALQKRAITGFAVDCEIEEALRKITMYFERLDNHKTLRGIAHES